MEPIRKKKAGRELGNAAACAAIAGVSWETFQWYVRTGKPEGNPPPGHVEIDNETGQRMYPLRDVRAWQKARPGRGNWGGIGARARKPTDAADALEAQSVTAATLAASSISTSDLAAQTITTDTLTAD